MRRLAPVLATALLFASGCSSGGQETTADAPTSASPSATGSPTGSPAEEGPDAEQPPADDEQGSPRSGAVALGPKAPCETTYSATEVRQREFAFDGTITAIDGDVVTFETTEWFAGGGDLPTTAAIGFAPAATPGPSETAPAYGVGDRLLVSGDGTIAWGCGFTRYFDEETAADWRTAS